MGGCLIERTRNLEHYPQDLSKFDIKNKSEMIKMGFEGCLRRISIQDSEESLGLIFVIPDLFRANLQMKAPSNCLTKWQINGKFKFEADDYEIRTKFLSIQVIQKGQLVLDTFKINLYRIVTGPSRYTFKLNSKAGRAARLHFELKVSQLVDFIIQSLYNEVKFNNQHPGDRFNFTLQSIMQSDEGGRKKLQTRPGYPIEIPLLRKNQQVSPRKHESKAMPKLKKEEKTQIIVWETAEDKQMPRLKVRIAVCDINSSMLQNKFWKLFRNNGQKDVLHGFGQCCINLHELLQTEVLKDDGLKMVRNTTISRDVEMNGNIIGVCESTYKISHKNYLKQVHNDTHTVERLKGQILEYSDAELTAVYGSSIQKIANITTKIMKEKTIVSTNNSFDEELQSINRVHLLLQQLNHEISSTLNQSFDIRQNELVQKQKLLMKTIGVIINLLEQDNIVLKRICWQVMVLLVQRGEFMLRNIGFLANHCKTGIKIDKKKKNIALKYQEMLGRLLSLSLHTIIRQGDFQDGTDMPEEIFKVYCYFRIPLFRQMILKSISDEKDFSYDDLNPKSIVGSTTTFELLQKQQLLEKQLNWDKYFYKPLADDPISQQLDNERRQMLEGHRWLRQLSQRKQVFVRFVYFFLSTLEKIQEYRKMPRYQYYNGYNRIVSSYLNEMKNLPLKTYNPTFCRTSMLLLANPELHETVIRLLLEKTNFFNSAMVLKTISIITMYMRHLCKDGLKIPISFCQSVFMKGIKQILKSQFSYCITKTILLVYTVYNDLQPEIQQYLTLYLFGNRFCFLFYHWSYYVRLSFQYLLLFKVAQNKGVFADQKGKLYLKYVQILSIIEKNEEQYHRNFKNTHRITKQQHLHQRMKEKLQKKNSSKQKNLAFIDKCDSQNKSTFPKQSMVSEIFNVTNQLPTYCTPSKSEGEAFLRARNNLSNEDSDVMIDMTNLNLTKKYTYHEAAKYNNCFQEQQFRIPQMTLGQINQIGIATQQFRNLNTYLRDYYDKHQELPDVDLGMSVYLDGKDIRPIEVDSLSM